MTDSYCEKLFEFEKLCLRLFERPMFRGEAQVKSKDMPSSPRRHQRTRNRRFVEPYEESGVPPCLPPLTPPEPLQGSSDEAGVQPPCNSNTDNDDGLAGDGLVKEAESNHVESSRNAPPSLAGQGKNPSGKHALGSSPAYVTASTTSTEARRGTDSSAEASANAIRESNSQTSTNEAAKTDSDPSIAMTPTKDVAKSDASLPSPMLMNAAKSRKGIGLLRGPKSGVKTSNDILTTPSNGPANSKSVPSEAAKNTEDFRKSSTAATCKDTIKTETSNPTTPSKDTVELESDNSGNLSRSKRAIISNKTELAMSKNTNETSIEDSGPTKDCAKLIRVDSSNSKSKSSSVVAEKWKDSKVGSSTVSNDSKDLKCTKTITKRAFTASSEPESTWKCTENLASSKGTESGSSRKSTTADGSKDSKDQADNIKKYTNGPTDLAQSKRPTRSSSMSTESSASKEINDSSGAPSDDANDQVVESTNKTSVSKDNAKSKMASQTSPLRKSVRRKCVEKTDSKWERAYERSSKGAKNTNRGAKNKKEAAAKNQENLSVNDACKTKNERRKSISKMKEKLGVGKTDTSLKMSIGNIKFSRYSEWSEEKLGNVEIEATDLAPTAIVKGGQAKIGQEKRKSSRALSVASFEDGSQTPFNFDKATSDSSDGCVTTMKQPPPPARKLSLPAVLDQEYLLSKSMKQPGQKNSATAGRTKLFVSLISKQADEATPAEKATVNSEAPKIFRGSLALAPISFDPALNLLKSLSKKSLRTTGEAKGLGLKQQNQTKLWKEKLSKEESDEEDEKEPVEEVIKKAIVSKTLSLFAERIHVELEKDVTTPEIPADKTAFRDSTAQQETDAKEAAQKHAETPALRTKATHPQLIYGSRDQFNESEKNFSKVLEQIYTPKVPPTSPPVVPDKDQSRQPSTGSITDSITDVTKVKSDRMDATESVRNFFAKRGSASDRLSVSVVQEGLSPSQHSCASKHAAIAEKAMELFEMLETAMRQRRLQQQQHQKQQQTQQRLRTEARNSHSVQRPVQPKGFSSVGTFVAPLSPASAVTFSGGMISQAALQQIDFEEVSAEDLDDNEGTATPELSGASVPSSAVRANGNTGTRMLFKKLP